MTEALAIAAPLLALAVILVFAFAGCDYTPPEPAPPPASDVTFRARVPNGLEVLAPGVEFSWRRPGATADETATVAAPTSAAGSDNVFDQVVPAAESGAWTSRCALTVRANGQSADASSGNFPFTVDFAATPNIVVSFRAQGSPVTNDFAVVTEGVTPA